MFSGSRVGARREPISDGFRRRAATTNGVALLVELAVCCGNFPTDGKLVGFEAEPVHAARPIGTGSTNQSP